MRRLLNSLVALILASCVSAADPTAHEASRTVVATATGVRVTSELCPLDCPTGAPASDIAIDREIYRLSYNTDFKAATWVSYRVWKGSIRQGVRSDNYRGDPDIPDNLELQDSEYVGVGDAGYARGHQAPDKNLDGADPQRTIDFTSNLTPQRAGFNSGIWARLEEAERNLLDRGFESVYVVTGPYFATRSANDPKVPLKTQKPYRVPTGYWKVILVRGDEIGMNFVGFMFSQGDSGNFCTHVTPVAEIESMTGLDLFPVLDADMLERYDMMQGRGKSLLSAMGCGAQIR